MNARELLTHEDTYATVLLVFVLDTYGPEAYEWTADTFRVQLAEDFGVTIPTLTIDKLMAAISIVTSDAFYQDVSRFISLCNVLSGSELSPEVVDLADARECAWGITEVQLLDPPETEDPFAEEIRRYLGQVLWDEGFVTPPDILRLASGPYFHPAGPTGFTDDPDMAQAMMQRKQSDADDINAIIQDGLLELFNQLGSLELKVGNARDLAARLSASLKQEAGHGGVSRRSDTGKGFRS